MRVERLTDERLRTELLSSHERLLRGEISERLLQALAGRFPEEYLTAFVIEEVPEQTETLYTLVMAGDVVVRLELPRSDSAPVLFRRMTLCDYEKEGGRLPRPDRRRLEMAKTLIRELPGA